MNVEIKNGVKLTLRTLNLADKRKVNQGIQYLNEIKQLENSHFGCFRITKMDIPTNGETKETYRLTVSPDIIIYLTKQNDNLEIVDVAKAGRIRATRAILSGYRKGE